MKSEYPCFLSVSITLAATIVTDVLAGFGRWSAHGRQPIEPGERTCFCEFVALASSGSRRENAQVIYLSDLSAT